MSAASPAHPIRLAPRRTAGRDTALHDAKDRIERREFGFACRAADLHQGTVLS